MPIAPETIAAYAPWGNAELAFTVGGSTTSIDAATGNVVETPVVLEYLAALSPDGPNWAAAQGADATTYNVRGRLLVPATLDYRITNGSQAVCVLNGMRGRFELTFALAQDAFHRSSLRQEIQGVFRVIGGPGA
jgi:hypothetical protein